MLQTYSKRVLVASSRTAMAAPEPPRQESNVFKGQHMKYIPKKRLDFNVSSPEGPLTLIFQGNDALFKRANNWKISLGMALPLTGFAYAMVAPLWVIPLLYVPAAVNVWDMLRVKYVVSKSTAHKLYLYQNGTQVLLQTYDGMLHKLNLKDNNEHDVIDEKDSLTFVMYNSGRDFILRGKDAVKIDFDILDRILKGVPIDSKKYQKLYNRLTYRQLPANLKPTHFHRYVPQVFNPNSS